MKLLISDSPPFAFNNCAIFPVFEPTINCRFPGYGIEIMKMLIDYAKIKLEPYVVDATVVEWGSFENGNWTGMMKILEEGVVDVMTDIMQYTDQRAADFDYSYPLYNLQIVYITKQKPHDLYYYLWDSISPFGITTWLSLFFLFFSLTIVSVIIQYAEWKLGFLKTFDWTTKVGQYVRIIFYQINRPMYSHTVSDKIIFITFGFMLVALFSRLYGAFLLSPLLIQIDYPPFKNFDELISLIKSGSYHVVVDEANYKAYWYYEYLRTSNDSHFRRLRNALQKNPLLIVDNITAALDIVERGSYVYPTQQDQPEMVEARTRCNLIFLDVGLPQTRGYFLFHKNSSFLPAVNHAIKMNTNFISYIFQKYFTENFRLAEKQKICPNEEKNLEAKKPLLTQGQLVRGNQVLKQYPS